MQTQSPPAVRYALRPMALWLSLGIGCTKRLPSQPCTPGEVSCLDERTGLFCNDGRLATMSCLGPSGCQGFGKDGVACDNPVARVGDGCDQIDDIACTQDREAAMVCRGHKFVLSQSCKGPRRCSSANGHHMSCDHSVAEPGDVCTTEGDTACQVDRAALLKCIKGAFQRSNGCRGARHCTVTEKPDESNEQFECDDSLTLIGDPCEDNGEASCSVDHQSLHVCQAHRIAVSKPCPGPRACFWTSATARFDCDTHKR